MKLTEFLLARIAEDEESARDAASEGTPHRSGWKYWTSKVDTTPGGERLGPRGSIEASPARVLAECEAKRRILAIAEAATDMHSEWLMVEVALALPYADHSDYREEWRP